MTITTIQTNPTYAANERIRTDVAYLASREFQDIIHELTVCIRDGLSGDKCGKCMGCTFRTFLTSDPKLANRVVTYANQELFTETAESDEFTETYETDLSGFGRHFGQWVTLQVECSKWNELGNKVYKVGMVHAGQNGGFWPTSDSSDIMYKMHNTFIWEMFAEIVLNYIN
jgi:hypothetical protein